MISQSSVHKNHSLQSSPEKDLQENPFLGKGDNLQAIVSQYLKATSLWMLNYDARLTVQEQISAEPLRPQETDNPWLTSLSCVYLIDAAYLIGNSIPGFMEELEKKLLAVDLGENNPGVIHWLLEPRMPGWPIRSDALVYDTSITLLALLKICTFARFRKSKYWNRQLEQKVWTTLEFLLNWLVNEIGNDAWLVHDLAINGGLHVGRAIETITYLNKQYPRRFSSILKGKKKLLVKMWGPVIRFVDSRLSEQNNQFNRIVSSISRELFYGLSLLARNPTIELSKWIQFERERPIVLKMLESFVAWYEESLIDRLSRGFASGARNLAIYIYLDNVLDAESSKRNNYFLSELIVWSEFRKLIGNEQWYPNGSIYDNGLLETLWFLGLLTNLYQWNKSEVPIARFFDNILISITQLPLIEREEIFKLREEIILVTQLKNEIERKASAEKTTHKGFRRIYTIISLIILALYILAFLLPALGATAPIINPNLKILDLQSTIAIMAIIIPGAIALGTFLHSSSK